MGTLADRAPKAATTQRRTAMTLLNLKVNGSSSTVDVDPATPLLWVLRDVLGLTGTKYGCGIEVCGACTVWIDGSPEKSCHIPVKEVTAVSITTIEGVAAASARAAAVQKAFVDVQAPQCGYCQSGMIMRAAKVLAENAKPSDASIDSAIGNVCACGTYPRVRAAIKKASGQ
jgi:isoquinoline 1-oxidoreductase alpha subunit